MTPIFILNFHGLGEMTRTMPVSEQDCWLATAVFEAILDRVRARSDVRITFDDANESDYSIALPCLQARQMTAQFFVVARRIGQKSFLSPQQLQALHAAGMAIGNHGMSHRNWRGLSSTILREELVAARDSIEQMIGTTVREAGIPYGSYDRGVLQQLRQVGYQAAYTSDGGPASLASWLRPRNTVRRSHDFDRVQRSVSEIPAGVAKLRREAKLFIKRWR